MVDVSSDDPVGMASHVRETLTNDGAWMSVEPFAYDNVKDSLNPRHRYCDCFASIERARTLQLATGSTFVSCHAL